MKGTHIKRLSALLLLLAMLVSLAACGKEETPIEKTARYLQAQIPEPTCAAVGGDWLVFGLARSGLKAPQNTLTPITKTSRITLYPSMAF